MQFARAKPQPLRDCFPFAGVLLSAGRLRGPELPPGLVPGLAQPYWEFVATAIQPLRTRPGLWPADGVRRRDRLVVPVPPPLHPTGEYCALQPECAVISAADLRCTPRGCTSGPGRPQETFVPVPVFVPAHAP